MNIENLDFFFRVPVNWYITFKPGCDPNTGMFPFKLEIADRGMDCIPVVIPDEVNQSFSFFSHFFLVNSFLCSLFAASNDVVPS